MFDINESLNNWLEKLEKFNFIDYQKLPDIELYMDQILTIIQRQISVYNYSSFDKLLTSSMVNNYVKGNVIPAPISKKYNREHLALLEEVCTLKQVLSIAEVKQIIDSTYKLGTNNEQAFNDFQEKCTTANHKATDFTKDKLTDVPNNDTNKLNELALELSLIANSYISIAKRILYFTKHYDNMLEEQKDKKKKKEDKEEE